MLNLVQVQERLRDVPMQALMQYANGSNPQIPPFLALGELNRRKKMQESAAAEQAQQMEGAPTVKQQIEQAAGLMALQGNRQQQAAKQQQGIQATMPMAAPNTTTSEPAQLAAGGFLDDIVVPRDFQAGGQAMNPEMLKKLMMLQAMKKRQGVAGLPTDMFKRSDYAGGGIVAFQAGGSTFDEFMPDQESGSSEKATKEQIDRMTLPELQEYYRTGKIPARVLSPAEAPKQVSPTEAPRSTSPSVAPAAPSPAAPQAPAGRGGVASIPGAPKEINEAIKRALNLDLDKEFASKPERTFDQMMAEQKRRQGLAGISEGYLDEREKRLADIQARREQSRAEQPMDQLTTFLTGIAEGRGGTFGTQGARGAKASRELRAQQEALREKQDMEMEELKFTVASKRDAIRRGDMGAVEALEKEEERIRRELAKDKAAAIRQVGELASQEKYRSGSLGVEAQKAAAARDQNTFNQAMTAANLEAERVRSDLRRRAESMLDKDLNAKIKANPNYIDEQVEAARNRILRQYGMDALPGMTATAPSGPGVAVKLPNGKTMYFPNEEAANQFRQAAGIK